MRHATGVVVDDAIPTGDQPPTVVPRADNGGVSTYLLGREDGDAFGRYLDEIDDDGPPIDDDGDPGDPGPDDDDFTGDDARDRAGVLEVVATNLVMRAHVAAMQAGGGA